MCITTKDVFAWGSNEYGQLGHGDAAPDVCSRPFPIKVLHDVMVTQVRKLEPLGVWHAPCWKCDASPA